MNKEAILLDLIFRAVNKQAEDIGLWCEAGTIGEAYMQESLRDLHRVIEAGDIQAYHRIVNRVDEQ